MSQTSPRTALHAILCPTCASVLEPGSKFCGTCGSASTAGVIRQGGAQALAKPIPTVPTFAPVAPGPVPGAVSELKDEAGRLIVLLVRERLFLYMHWLIFLGLNLFGFMLAVKCYNGYIGDELTKLMMACTPLLYINCTALVCIVPIRGTRREIARLKERLNYVKFQIEYSHLF
ncbi:MAG TPA: hypothetical protein V6D08_11445 [Candidatus Obscuribacterales bacterium]